MRLRTQFIITILLFGLILVVVAASAIFTNQQEDKTGQQERIAAHIAQGASELSYLANDYLIYRESQQLKRWQSRFASFSAEVAALHVERPEQQALVTNIKANQQRLKEVFGSVSSAVGEYSQNRDTALDLSFLQVSWSRVAVQSQGLASDASRLSQLLHLQMDHLTKTGDLLLYVVLGLLGIFLLTTYMLTYHRILKSIMTLRAGAAVIGSGNLDFVLEEKRQDEIGQLSQAFNRMAADLKAVTASKADLEWEIAERKKAEEALRESEARFRGYFELGLIGMAITSPDKGIIDVNDKTCEILGYERSELLRMTGAELTHADDLADDIVYFNRVMAGEIDNYSINKRYIRKNGDIIYTTISVKCIRRADGSVDYFMALLQDITERKRVEDALRESEARYRNLVKYAPAGIYEVDFATACFTEVNDAMCQILGYSREEILAMTPFDILDQEGIAHFASRISSAQSGGQLEDVVEYRVRTKDGRLIWALLYITFYWNGGRIVRATVVSYDITERKRMEEELRQSRDELEVRVQERTAQLVKTSKILRDLSSKLLSTQEAERKRIAGEIHDTIGTGLAAIKFKIEHVQQQMRKIPEAGPESLNIIISMIQENIDECRRIQQDLRPSMLDDLGLLPTLSWFCRRYQAIYTGIKVEWEQTLEEKDLPDHLKIAIFRVIQEGMNNISKHSKADLVHLSLGKMDGRIGLVLRDNGQGFDLKKVLDLESTKRGLGLTSMRERTELSGGSFFIESAEGKGTVIRAFWSV